MIAYAEDPPVASALAASWKLVVGEPDDSYESYFAKVLGDQPVDR